jgi:hypothetical protein
MTAFCNLQHSVEVEGSHLLVWQELLEGQVLGPRMVDSLGPSVERRGDLAGTES